VDVENHSPKGNTYHYTMTTTIMSHVAAATVNAAAAESGGPAPAAASAVSRDEICRSRECNVYTMTMYSVTARAPVVGL